jgi:putative isomerase
MLCLLPLLLIIVSGCPGNSGVQLFQWNNTALVGNEVQTSLNSGVSLSLASPASGRLVGTLTSPIHKSSVLFRVLNDDPSIWLLLWLDDVLLVDTIGQNPFPNSVNAFEIVADKPYFLRAEFGQNVTVANGLKFALQWKADGDEDFQDIPCDVLTSNVSEPQLKRLRFLDGQKTLGWGTFDNRRMLNFVSMPQSAGFDLTFQELSSAEILSEVRVFRSDNAVQTRVGPHSTISLSDRFYAEITSLTWKKMNVTVQAGLTTSGALAIDVIPNGDNSDYLLLITPRMMFNRAGEFKLQASNPFITSSFPNLPSIEMFSITGSPKLSSSQDSALFKLSSEVIIGTDASLTLQTVHQSLNESRAFLKLSHRRYKANADVHEAMQTIMAWNSIYTPHEGLFTPVSRNWDFGEGYVIFDWDNYFAAVMASLNDPTMAVANLVAITKTKTVDGFVPNFQSGLFVSRDRTEPPVGALALKEVGSNLDPIDKKWLIDLLLDDLVDWNDWFWRKRTIEPLNLITLGSNDYPRTGPAVPGDQGTRGAAILESGLDNSPMYDKTVFDNVTGLLGVYDVGFSSLFVYEAGLLVPWLIAAGRSDDAAKIEARRDLVGKDIVEHLWDPETKMFYNILFEFTEDHKAVNLTLDKSSMSPTNFYPMIDGVATAEQAIGLMVHLANETEFCVSGTCSFGMPSISRNNPTFKGNFSN